MLSTLSERLYSCCQFAGSNNLHAFYLWPVEIKLLRTELGPQSKAEISMHLKTGELSFCGVPIKTPEVTP